MNLYIYKYNNYYNRIVKKEDVLTGYGTPIHILFNCKDFSPNDGVNTTHVFGSVVNNYDGSGDYLIVANENNEIIFRWFIIETKFARNGQWILTLRRDLVVDYYNDVINAECFIEKATLSANDILLYNEEQFSVNQIKKDEKLLKDKSGCPWLVGYYAADATGITGTVLANELINVPYVQLTTTIEDWDYYQYQNEDARTNVDNMIYRFHAGNQYTDISKDGIWLDYDRLINYPSSLRVRTFGETLVALPNKVKENKTALLDAAVPAYISNYVTNEILNYENTIVRDTDGKVFRVKLINKGHLFRTDGVTAGSLFNLMAECAKAAYDGIPNGSSFSIRYNADTYRVQLEELTDLETTYNITTTSRLITEDAPWNIFAIPYGEITVNNATETLVTTTKEIAMQTAMGIQKQHPSKIFDIQLLPYCPVQDLITDDAELTVTNPAQYSFITAPAEAETQNVGIIFNINRSRFDFNIIHSIAAGATSIEKKLNNQCDKWRLAAPNYSNYFDFSVEKNGGVDYFNVDCEYKPFTPYVHINPNFKNLYGNDFNDVRGLVLGGDFSISQIIDQWEQYQVQNKNFQNIFDRQIQNMEVQNNVGRIKDVVSSIAGAGQGLAAGGFVGGLLDKTAVGAATGGVLSAAAGIADIAINEALRTEAMDYTKDLFGYQLGNIQALPQTISKVSALNNNNKLFPVLEYYSCEDREKEAFIKKMRHNGMTVMVIDTIAAYLNNYWSIVINDKTIANRKYIKGQIILMENLEDEFHLLKEISNEIYKGVYF